MKITTPNSQAAIDRSLRTLMQEMKHENKVLPGCDPRPRHS
jgi:hypothetical protein